MSSHDLSPPNPSYLPTLVFDANVDAANQLVQRLSHRGFPNDVVSGCRAAREAIRNGPYGTIVMVADLNPNADLECLSGLRSKNFRTWIIVIGSTPHAEAQKVVRQMGGNAVLIAPFSVEDLTFRLSAFAHRSRPP